MDGKSPKSVGLGGDGDEIFAVADVECALSIKLDYGDALYWLTAGDLFASVQRVLPEQLREDPDVWQRFAVALCGQTGMNPKVIEPNSPLLSQSRFWARLADASALLWIVTMVGFVPTIGAIVISKL